jgi:hypothetical protein
MRCALVVRSSTEKPVMSIMSIRISARLVGFILAMLVIGGGLTHASAQVFTPGADMLAQDQDLGPGCNEIGLGIPTENQPLMPEQSWLDDHSVCVEDRLKATGMCYGITDGVDQIELCMFMVVEADGSMEVACPDMVLDTDSGVYGPHPELTDSLIDQVRSFSEDRNFGVGALFEPCTATPLLSPNTFVFAAFDGLDPTDEPVVLRVNVETGKFVAVVSDEPTLDVRAVAG